MSPVGAIFVPSPLKTGTNLLHPRSPESLNDSGGVHTFMNYSLRMGWSEEVKPLLSESEEQ